MGVCAAGLFALSGMVVASAEPEPAKGVGDEHHRPAAAPGTAEFERIKRLAGVWQGTSKMHGTEEPAAVEYRVTSGGSAVVETLFPGTDHEMVSVYHDEGGTLAMTHYCMLGNRPKLTASGGTDAQLAFSLASEGGVSAEEPHMHSLTIAFADADHITQSWTLYENGQAKDTTTISLSRVY